MEQKELPEIRWCQNNLFVGLFRLPKKNEFWDFWILGFAVDFGNISGTKRASGDLLMSKMTGFFRTFQKGERTKSRGPKGLPLEVKAWAPDF